jgi:hypothetical protein
MKNVATNEKKSAYNAVQLLHLTRVARFFKVQYTKEEEKYTKLLRNVPNGHRIYHLALK